MHDPSGGSTEQGTHLCAKHIRPVEHYAEAAPAEEGIGFFTEIEVGGRLVTAQVRGTYHYFPTCHRGVDGRISRKLLCFVRVAIEEKELRAKQPNTLRTMSER